MSLASLRFDYSLLKLGRQLTDQQLWCLGCDVRHPHFPMKELGWTYHRLPKGINGCGRMTGETSNGAHLSMWGFGFLVYEPAYGALLLDRKGFLPRWTDAFDVHQPLFTFTDLPKCTKPADETQVDAVLYLLIELVNRLAEHEDRTNELLGFGYRCSCVDQWKFRRTALDAFRIPGLWREVAVECQLLRDRNSTRRLGISSRASDTEGLVKDASTAVPTVVTSGSS